MKRRNFLASILALPFIRYIPKPKELPTVVSMTYTYSYTPIYATYLHSLEAIDVLNDETRIDVELSDGTSCYRTEVETGLVGEINGPPKIYYDSITHLPVKFQPLPRLNIKNPLYHKKHVVPFH